MLDFTLISTKNVDLTKASQFKRGNNRVNGEDGVYWILYFPLGSPNLKEAVDRAIEKIPGCIALVDGVVYHESWWAILTGYSSYVIEGTPLIDPSLISSNVNIIGTYNICVMDKEGYIKEMKTISKEEFENDKSKIFILK
jgi:hypothetical protein